MKIVGEEKGRIIIQCSMTAVPTPVSHCLDWLVVETQWALVRSGCYTYIGYSQGGHSHCILTTESCGDKLKYSELADEMSGFEQWDASSVN